MNKGTMTCPLPLKPDRYFSVQLLKLTFEVIESVLHSATIITRELNVTTATKLFGLARNHILDPDLDFAMATWAVDVHG